MSDLFEALLVHPDRDDCLLVYCDALEEQGDPRADYARTQLRLRSSRAEGRAALLRELRRTYPAEHPAWVGQLELACAFEPNLTAHESVWWGVGIENRESAGTYQAFEGRRQPPLPVAQFDGSWDWLRGTENILGPELGYQDEALWSARLRELTEQGFHVPPAFGQLMFEAALKARVPSCTDNYFLKVEQAGVHAQPDGSVFLTFYSDSQDCVIWGIRLGRNADRYSPVLSGCPQWSDDDDDDASFAFPELEFASPTIERFIYRWWLENTIWFATHDPWTRALTAEEQRYIRHFGDESGG